MSEMHAAAASMDAAKDLRSRGAYDAIAPYIDGFYNPVRRHSGLGYLSSIDYEAASRGAQDAA